MVFLTNLIFTVKSQSVTTTNLQYSRKIPQSLLTATSSPDQFANMIRNSQYGRTDESSKKLNLDDSEENLLTVRKILSESDICRAICDIKNLTDNIEKIEHRMVGEIRKVNLKLINFERNLLNNLTSKFEEIIKVEMNAIKNEILKNLRDGNLGK